MGSIYPCGDGRGRVSYQLRLGRSGDHGIGDGNHGSIIVWRVDFVVIEALCYTTTQVVHYYKLQVQAHHGIRNHVGKAAICRRIHGN